MKTNPENIEKKKRKHKKHWYRQYMGSCPVCGRNESYRERVYGKKPKDKKKCYVWLSDFETYDNCLG